jgi:hypothetical protein
MNDNPPMSRARYLRTLRRFCGPVMGWRVVNAANTNNRTATLSRACAAGEAFDPRVSPNSLQNVSHDAPYTGERA